MIKIEIEGIEDFKEFIRIVRRQHDDSKIIKETQELNEASNALNLAIEKNKEKS